LGRTWSKTERAENNEPALFLGQDNFLAKNMKKKKKQNKPNKKTMTRPSLRLMLSGATSWERKHTHTEPTHGVPLRP
jgi:hypothetical protein